MERRISTMRAKTLVALIVTALMLTPVQAGDVTASQSQQQEDPKQPNANNTTMYMWSNGMATEWSHFNLNETESVEDPAIGLEMLIEGVAQAIDIDIHGIRILHGEFPDPQETTLGTGFITKFRL